MPTVAPATMTGVLKSWDARAGCGLIRSESGRMFFAHASQFPGDCACGQLHKCAIQPGMAVTFSEGARPTGKVFAVAIEIRIKAEK